MGNKQLLEKLNRLGFPLMETEEDFEANKTLAEVVESGETRYWEGFPVLLANAAKGGGFEYKAVAGLLKNEKARARLKELFLLSLALYRCNHLKFAWAEKFYTALSVNEKNRLKEFKDCLEHNHDFEVAGRRFSPQRVKDMFAHYFKEEVLETKKMRSKHEELSLEYSLSQVFSPKQKELFFKRLNGEPFTKTEREYFSRAVKRKVLALANPELHRLAQKVLEY